MLLSGGKKKNNIHLVKHCLHKQELTVGFLFIIIQMSKILRTSSLWKVFRNKWMLLCWTTLCVITHSKQTNLGSFSCGYQKSGPSVCRPKNTSTTNTWTGMCRVITFSLKCCMQREHKLYSPLAILLSRKRKNILNCSKQH